MGDTVKPAVQRKFNLALPSLLKKEFDEIVGRVAERRGLKRGANAPVQAAAMLAFLQLPVDDQDRLVDEAGGAMFSGDFLPLVKRAESRRKRKPQLSEDEAVIPPAGVGGKADSRGRTSKRG